MPTAGIANLAVELIQEIALYVPTSNSGTSISRRTSSKSSLTSLRLVSRQFKFAVDPYALSKITFNFGGIPSNVVCDRLAELASGSQYNSVCRFARVLTITDLEPDSTEEDRRGFAKRQIANGRLGNVLVQAVKSLQNLHALRWDIASTFLMYSLLDGLFHLPNIQELYLNFLITGASQQPGIFPLRRFKHIRRISLTSIANLPFYNDIIHQLSESVGRTPDLTHLDIGLSKDNTIFANLECVLHTLVQNARSVTKSTPLRLQHLRVHGVTLHVDSLILCHLRELSALDISWLPGRDNSRIWANLLAASIHLTKISVDRICPSLLDYLSSYAGLENFSLIPPDKRVPFITMNDHSLQNRLFETVLPIHKDYLKMLYLGRKSHPREWRMRLEHLEWLSACKEIVELALSIPIEELRKDGFFKAVVVISFNGLPKLQTLRVNDEKMDTSSSRHQPRSFSGHAPPKWQMIAILDAIILELDPVNDFMQPLGMQCEILSQDVRYALELVEVQLPASRFAGHGHGYEHGYGSGGRWVRFVKEELESFPHSSASNITTTRRTMSF